MIRFTYRKSWVFLQPWPFCHTVILRQDTIDRQSRRRRSEIDEEHVAEVTAEQQKRLTASQQGAQPGKVPNFRGSYTWECTYLYIYIYGRYK